MESLPYDILHGRLGKHERLQRLLFVGMGLVLVVGIAGGRFAFERLQKDLKALEDDVRKVELDLAFKDAGESVDLTETHFQDIDESFSIGRVNVTKHLSGARIAGIILNRSSVGHERLTLRVKILGESKEFTVPKVRPGYAARFSVYLPDVKAEGARLGKFEYVRSTVLFYQE